VQFTDLSDIFIYFILLYIVYQLKVISSYVMFCLRISA